VTDSKHPSPAEFAAAAVRRLQPYVPGKPLDELEREYGIRNAVKLASNENPAGPAAPVLQAMQQAVAGVNRYPDGAGYYLKQKLARHLKLNASQLTLGNGSNDLLVLLAEAFLTPATNAVFSEYAFVVYPLAVQATGAEARVIPATPAPHEQPLGHDLDAMLAAIDGNTRLVFIANPNNPTGSWLAPAALHAFLQQVPPSTVVVLDEAYCEYISDAAVHESPAWLAEFPNLVITRTFSKIYGLAGLRVGYALSSPALAELLNRIRQPFNINSVALAGALAALDEQEYVLASRANNRAGMTMLHEALAPLPGVRVLPSQANFVLLKLEHPAAPVYDALLQAGVIVRPVGNYGLPNYLRVTIGTAAENEAFVRAFVRILQDQ
jgi:histidinol-phosphate aminotransferase